MYINVDIPKSDLSECEINDWVWIFAVGWLQITSIKGKGYDMYPIEIGHEILCTLNGYLTKNDISPSVWDYNPFNSNDYPPESIFAPTKGDRVLVSNANNNVCIHKRYFSHKDEWGYNCYINGRDKWSSEGKTRSWEYCKPVEQEN